MAGSDHGAVVGSKTGEFFLVSQSLVLWAFCAPALDHLGNGLRAALRRVSAVSLTSSSIKPLILLDH